MTDLINCELSPQNIHHGKCIQTYKPEEYLINYLLATDVITLTDYKHLNYAVCAGMHTHLCALGWPFLISKMEDIRSFLFGMLLPKGGHGHRRPNLLHTYAHSCVHIHTVHLEIPLKYLRNSLNTFFIWCLTSVIISISTGPRAPWIHSSTINMSQ